MGRLGKGGTVKGILKRDRRCWLCKNQVSARDASRDHVDPKADGGYDRSKNYRLAHKACNNARGRMPESHVMTVLADLPLNARTSQVVAVLIAANREWLRLNR